MPRPEEHEHQRPPAHGGVSVVVPAFNEEGGIGVTLDRLAATLQPAGFPFEVIVVDDGSTDGTPDVLATRPDARVVRHPTNRGYGASLKTGIRYARYELIVILDADGTYPVEQIPALLALAPECDMVVGARLNGHRTERFARRAAKRGLKRFVEWMARRPVPDFNSGLRVFRRSVVLKFLKILPDGFSFTTTITLAMLTNSYRVHFEPIDYHPRVGRSKIRPVRDTLWFLQLILRTGMYFAPLRVFLPVAAIGFVGFLVSFTCDLLTWNLNERTLLLLVAATHLAMFSLLADMIDKRTG